MAPTYKDAARVIGAAEAVVGQMTLAVRCALLDEHWPDVPACELAKLARVRLA